MVNKPRIELPAGGVSRPICTKCRASIGAPFARDGVGRVKGLEVCGGCGASLGVELNEAQRAFVVVEQRGCMWCIPSASRDLARCVCRKGGR